MNAAERRQRIKQMLLSAPGPVSATVLATQCGVSRQIIVGDVALLRAGGLAVLATPRGYVLDTQPAAPAYAQCSVACRHANDRLLEELYTIVDLGGTVIDVTVEHAVYGQLCGQLHISSRFDADEFAKQIADSQVKPLSTLTGGIHLHCIRAADEAALARIIAALQDKQFLVTESEKEG